MGWLFIIMGVGLIAVAIWFINQQGGHTRRLPKPKQKPKFKPKPKPIKKVSSSRRIAEKKKPVIKPVQNKPVPSLSQHDIRRIQEQGLNYMDKE